MSFENVSSEPYPLVRSSVELRTPSIIKPCVHLKRTFVRPSRKARRLSRVNIPFSSIMHLENISSDPDPLLLSSVELRTPSVKKPYVHLKRTLVRSSRKERMLSRVNIPFSSINQVNEIQMELQAQLFVDDDDGHLNFNVGDTIEKYDLLGFLGKGTFGRVAKARNMDTCQIVALKIVKNTEGCRESARNEVLILKTLKDIDPDGKHLWIQMLDYFEFQGHVCIAFEKLGDSLYSFMRANRYRPYQLCQVRHIAYQLCYSVKALHDNMIIHTDLKPENICLVSSDFTYGVRLTRLQTYRKPISTNIRLIDFGSAIDFFEDRDVMIQTRYYRAPEVIFGLQWNQSVDVWSIGCILFELYTGKCLFTVHDDDDEHYHIMLDVLGPLPDLYHSTKLAEKHVNLNSLERKKKTYKPLKKSMHMSTKEHQEFFDLMEKMLNYNPGERLTLTAALKHPFFSLLSDDQKLIQ